MYRLKVTLRGSRPAIWRRVEIDAAMTLAQFHRILQVVMGWTDSHLHQFRRGTTYYGQPDPEFGMHRENERRVCLGDVLVRPKERMVYEYDFGDGWEHDIVLEAIDAGAPEQPRARIVAGRGACPPEDVGGIDGYYGFLDAIQNASHPEHDAMVDWGGPFDPDAFEIDAINKRLARGTRKRRDA